MKTGIIIFIAVLISGCSITGQGVQCDRDSAKRCVVRSVCENLENSGEHFQDRKRSVAVE